MNSHGHDSNTIAASPSGQHKNHHNRHPLHHYDSPSVFSNANLGKEIRERRRHDTSLSVLHSHLNTGRSGQPIQRHTSRRLSEVRGNSGRVEIEEEEEEEYYQATLWWFTSVAFPLIAGTFGPIANLFSICGLVQTWRVTKPSGSRVGDPAWVLALNILSLVLALLANLLLLFNFAKRIPYRVAQPLTIIFWYLSCVLLLAPIIVTHTTLLHQSPTYALSQSYYHAFIACILYFIISTLLLLNVLGASSPFNAYAPSFAQLSNPQRTIMLQTILFSAYLALGGGVFAAIEGWDFVDGVYWADYTLLTIGLGSDFPVAKVAGRMLLIPYAALGIVFVGLIVGSIRELVLQRGKARISKRKLAKERQRWEGIIDQGGERGKGEAQDCTGVKRKSHSGREVRRFVKAREKYEARESHRAGMTDDAILNDYQIWRKREFELMRYIEKSARRKEGYIALGFSIFAFVIVWVGGSLVFWACEQDDAQWTYPTALYFAYTSITTIGYGDFYPTTASTRPFFVIWSLIAVPTVTVLVSTMGETVLEGVKEGVVWLGSKSLLPERGLGDEGKAIDVEGKEGGKVHSWIRRRRMRIGSATSSQQPIHDSSSRTAEEVATQTEAGAPLTWTQTEGTQTQTQAQGEGEGVREDGTHMDREYEESLGLVVRLAREITRVARDASQVPPIRYTWTEWVEWLKLMDEARGTLGIVVAGTGAGTRRKPPLARLGEYVGEGDERRAVRLVPKQKNCGGVASESVSGSENGDGDGDGEGVGEVWKWTWLDDQGPLFSPETETQWVLNKLCMLLEEVTRKEVEAAVGR